VTVEQTDVVDSIVFKEADKEIWLAISDHLSWTTDLQRHLDLLVKKISHYIDFIEEGELAQRFPSSSSSKLRIILYSANEPPIALEEMFFAVIRDGCSKKDIEFEVHRLPHEPETEPKRHQM
jgi:hypothetical protein